MNLFQEVSNMGLNFTRGKPELDAGLPHVIRQTEKRWANSSPPRLLAFMQKSGTFLLCAPDLCPDQNLLVCDNLKPQILQHHRVYCFLSYVAAE